MRDLVFSSVAADISGCAAGHLPAPAAWSCHYVSMRLLADVFSGCFVNRVVYLQADKEFLTVGLAVDKFAHERDASPLNLEQRTGRQFFFQYQRQTVHREI